MTYHAALKKYIMAVSTSSSYPFMTKHFDTYFLESDNVVGPWARVVYLSDFGPESYFVHFPSKFLAAEANTNRGVYDAFLMYSANFAVHDEKPNPPNSGYHMNLHQSRFKLSASFAQRLEHTIV